MADIEMLPCPFCGSHKVDVSDNDTKDNFPDTWWVQCGECDARGPAHWHGEIKYDHDNCQYYTERTEAECREAAIAGWNGRVSA